MENEVEKSNQYNEEPPIAKEVEPTYEEISRVVQSTVNNRLRSFVTVKGFIHPKENPLYKPHKLFDKVKELGRGGYGIVYLYSLVNNKNIRIAGKTSKASFKSNLFNHDREYDSAKNESKFSTIINGFIEERKSPNFVLSYGSYEGTIGGKPNFTLLAELADGNMSHWALGDHTSLEWLSVFFQIVHAYVIMAREKQIVHNDSYGRNILYNNVQSGTYYDYVIQDSKGIDHHFKVPIVVLIKLTDFGASSSEHWEWNGKTHLQALNNTPSAILTRDNFYEVLYNKHILAISGTLGYERDVLSFFLDMYPSLEMPSPVKNWIKQSLDVMKDIIFDKADYYNFSQPEVLVDWFLMVFNPVFLANAGLQDVLKQNTTILSADALKNNNDFFYSEFLPTNIQSKAQ